MSNTLASSNEVESAHGLRFECKGDNRIFELSRILRLFFKKQETHREKWKFQISQIMLMDTIILP